MKDWLVVVSENVIVVIDAIAMILIVVATLESVFAAVRALLSPPAADRQRAVWLRYARWLVAALTLQLAADIIETSITESWEAVGRIAAIAVVRTFLNFFLERDLSDVRERRER
jgi:uncharacterized membrane protein